MLDEQVAAQIRLELELIERLLASYQDLLARASQSITTEPTLIETTAIASVLHSFYNGLENIFQLIAKRFDQQSLSGDRWHQSLLEQMTKNTERRAAILTAETAAHLRDYLGFRHFYRHSYSFVLDWRRIAVLVVSLPGVAQAVRTEIETWLSNPSLQ